MTLPEGWRRAILRDLCLRVPNCTPEQTPGRVFEYVDIGSIDNKFGRIVETKKIPGKEAPSRARRPIQPGDVVFSNVRTYLRNIARVTKDINANLCSTGFTVFRPGNDLDQDYLFHFLRSEEFIATVTPEQTGTHYPATSDRVVFGQSIPLPPNIEQQRQIATKLDRIAARLDEVKARLTTVPALIKHFRQSILAAACSGRITEDWRQQNHSAVSVPNSFGPLNDNLPELPESWRYARLGSLLHGTKYGTAKKCDYKPAAHPVLRIPNIGEGRIIGDDLKYANLPEREYQQLALEPGDLLLIRSNGSVSLVGRAALVTPDFAGYAYAGYLIRLRPKAEMVVPEYLNRVLASFPIRLQIEVPARSTSGVNNINSEEVANLLIPLPPTAEQLEIVRRVEDLMHQADAIEDRYDKAMTFIDKLMPSILAKAFHGELT